MHLDNFNIKNELAKVNINDIIRSMITASQMRAARALLNWTQDNLAERSGVSKPTIARIELTEGASGGYRSTQEKLRHTLEAAGIVFIEKNGGGAGVRLRG